MKNAVSQSTYRYATNKLHGIGSPPFVASMCLVKKSPESSETSTVHYRRNNISPLIPITNHINPVHAF